MKKLNKKEILKNSPTREWNNTKKLYDRIWLIPAGTKHDSGYMHIAVVGVTNGSKNMFENGTYEICAYPDDISTYFPTIKSGSYEFAQVRMDCFYPSGILQYHGRNGKFFISEALSSIDIKFIPNN